MEGVTRGRFQGVANIIRFNWHLYIISLVLVIGLIVVTQEVSLGTRQILMVIILLAILSTALSLAASFYIYDCSNLYSLEWLDNAEDNEIKVVNINAGFDETSLLISKRYPLAELTVLDFYDAAKHTEVSIERARKSILPYPGTKNISTTSVPIEADAIDLIFVFLSAHEIRDGAERISFFKKLRAGLKQEGKIIVVEHLRDVQNFLVYNIGVFHFFSLRHWMHTFTSAGLSITREIKITPFVSAFILQNSNGISS